MKNSRSSKTISLISLLLIVGYGLFYVIAYARLGFQANTLALIPILFLAGNYGKFIGALTGFGISAFLSIVRIINQDPDFNYLFAFLIALLAAGSGGLVGYLKDQRDAVRLSKHLLEEKANQLQEVQKELEAFSYAVSHDLRAPLRAIDGFSRIIIEEHSENLDPDGKRYLHLISGASQKMGKLINDLLQLSLLTKSELHYQSVDISEMAAEIVADFKKTDPKRPIEVRIASDLRCSADPGLLRIALVNLLGNAWKFTRKIDHPTIEFGSKHIGGTKTYYVKDNGVGFNMEYADKLFKPFQRLHGEHDFDGTGIGLATVERIIKRHGGHIWPEAQLSQGATFYFTLEI